MDQTQLTLLQSQVEKLTAALEKSEAEKDELRLRCTELEQRATLLDKKLAGLRGDKELLESILNNAPAVIMVQELDGGVRLMNSIAARYGYMACEHGLPESPHSFLSPDSYSRLERARMRVATEGVPMESLDRIELDSETVFFHSVRFPLFDAGGTVNAVGLIAVDMSQGKIALDLFRVQRNWCVSLSEAADFQDALKRFQDASLLAPGVDFSCVFSVEQGSGILNLIQYSGLTEDEAWLQAQSFKDAYLSRNDVAPQAAGGRYDKTISGETTLPSSSFFPVYSSKGLEAIVIAGRRDNRRIAKEALDALGLMVVQLGVSCDRFRDHFTLRETETRFRQLAGNIDSVFWLYSLEENRNLYVSPAFESVWGIPAEKVLIDPEVCLPVIHHQDRPHVEEALRTSLVNPRERLDLAFRIVRSDGRIRWLQDSISGVRGSDGGFIRLAGLTRDVTSIKMAELMVLESEKRMRAIFNAAENIAFIMTSPVVEKSKIVEFSPGAEKIFGYDKREVVGRDTLFLIPSDWLGVANNVRNEAVSGECLRDLKVEAVRKNGEIFQALLSVFPIKDISGGVDAILSVLMDLSELNEKDRALKDSQEKYRYLVENSNEAILVLDRADVLFFNRRFLEFINSPDVFFLDFSIFDLIHPDDLPVVRYEHELRLSGINWDYPLEFRIQRPGGNSAWLLANGASIEWEGRPAILYFFIDITEQKKIEEELRRSQDAARALLNAVTETLILVEPMGAILEINEMGARRLGGEPKDFIGLGIYDVLPMDSAVSRNALAAKAVREGRPVLWEDERAGRYYSNSIYPVFDRTGAKVSMAIFARDVTEEKKAREQLISYQNQLRRMALELTAAEARERRRISDDLHDHIGQILFIAKMKLETLTWGGREQVVVETARELIRLIGKALSDVRHLMIEISPPVLHILGLDAALMELGENMKNQYGLEVIVENESLNSSLGEDIQNLLFRATRELAFNTVKHAQAKELNITMRASDGAVIITVRDDGVGFDVERAFREAGKANGFGLFSLRERLDASGGRLIVDSTPGQGAIASVIMPLADLPDD